MDKSPKSDTPKLKAPTHDSQEEEYSERGKIEGDKFDNRLFWFTGGAIALSLGYFQGVGILRSEPFIIAAYSFLISCIILMLYGLQFSASTNFKLAKWFRDKNEGTETDRTIYDKLSKRTTVFIPIINYFSLALSISGIICLVIYMFISA